MHVEIIIIIFFLRVLSVKYKIKNRHIFKKLHNEKKHPEMTWFLNCPKAQPECSREEDASYFDGTNKETALFT